MAADPPLDAEVARRLLEHFESSDYRQRVASLAYFLRVLEDPEQLGLPPDMTRRMNALVEASLWQTRDGKSFNLIDPVPPLNLSPPGLFLSASSEMRIAAETIVMRMLEERGALGSNMTSDPGFAVPLPAGALPSSAPASTYPLPVRPHVQEIPISIRLALQVISATGLFLLVAAVAVGLGFLTKWTETLPIPSYINLGLQGLELLLYSVDLLSMVIFVCSETAVLIDLLIPGRRQAAGRAVKRLFIRWKGRGTP